MESSPEKIVIVTSYPLDDEPVVRNRLKVYAEIFFEDGWDVVIISLSSFLRNGNALIHDDGIKVKYVYAKKYRKDNFIIRAFFELIHSVRLIQEANKIEADCCLVSIPSMFLLPPTAFLSNGKRKIVDIRDISWEYLPEQNYVIKIVKTILRLLFASCIRQLDLIAISNLSELKYIQNVVQRVPSVLVSNGISIQQFKKIQEIKFKLREGRSLNIAYIGNVGFAQNLKILIEAVANIKGVHLRIVGAGTDFTNVQAFVEWLRPENIELYGRVSWEEVLEVYAKSDLLYTQLSRNFKSAMPSKLYEYLSTGLPVLYGGTGAATEILTEFENVIVIEPDNVDILRETILVLLHNPAISRSHKNIKIIRKKYIRENYVRKLNEMLKNRGYPKMKDGL